MISQKFEVNILTRNQSLTPQQPVFVSVKLFKLQITPEPKNRGRTKFGRVNLSVPGAIKVKGGGLLSDKESNKNAQREEKI